jgi:hypothetical protein
MTPRPDNFADIPEPLKRFEIEMIRRLVEQQEVGSMSNRRDARMIQPLNARHGRNQFRESESSEHTFAFGSFSHPPAHQNMERIVICRVGTGSAIPARQLFRVA